MSDKNANLRETPMSKIILAAVAAFTIAGVSQQAMAQDAQKAPSQTVSIANVNFDSAKQVSAFYNKIWRIADRLCDSNSANPQILQADRACTEDAIAAAVRDANKPMLTAMYNDARTNRDIRLASR
jgi:UrcA family protein